MTPEAIRTVSQLRQEFYDQFATKMNVPVKITTRNPSTGNLPMASWIDERQRMNYLCVYVHTAPDKLLPERPFILRVSVNKGAGIIKSRLWGRDCRGINQSWHFDLTLLPEEILDFCHWMVSLIKSHRQGCVLVVPEPPHPFDLKLSNNKMFINEAWTQKARQEIGVGH